VGEVQSPVVVASKRVSDSLHPLRFNLFVYADRVRFTGYEDLANRLTIDGTQITYRYNVHGELRNLFFGRARFVFV
jgi:hypothetical protein